MLVLVLPLSGTSIYEIFNRAAVEKITNKDHTASQYQQTRNHYKNCIQKAILTSNIFLQKRILIN